MTTAIIFLGSLQDAETSGTTGSTRRILTTKLYNGELVPRASESQVPGARSRYSE
jgi:hypothetical protein